VKRLVATLDFAARGSHLDRQRRRPIFVDIGATRWFDVREIGMQEEQYGPPRIHFEPIQQLLVMFVSTQRLRQAQTSIVVVLLLLFE
jgi:hypothetical protein